jgi:transposase InsO family protein
MIGPERSHSEQGVPYAATAYTELLAGRGVAISMAALGKPEENGYTERLMRTIREEEVDLSEYRDFADAHGQLGRFLDDVYNRKRIHSSLGYRTPAPGLCERFKPPPIGDVRRSKRGG